MSGRKYFIRTALIFLLSLAPLFAQNLKQVVDLSLKQNKQLQAQKLAYKRSQLEARAVFRQTLPSIDFKASYRHVTVVPEIEFPAFFPGAVVPPIRLGLYDTYESGITASYVLFSGFALKNKVRLMTQKADLENLNLTQKQKQIVFQVIAAYRQVQGGQLEIDVLNASMERVQWQIRRLRSLVKQGMALSLDTLSLTLARLNISQQLIAARGKLATARQQLNQLVGQEVEVQPFTPPETLILNAEPLIEQMDAYRQLNQQNKMQMTNLKLTQSAYYPTLAVFASYNYGKPGLDFIQNKWMDYGIWGVSLSWNLFRWNSDKLQEQAARAGLKQIEWQKEAVKDQLKTRFDSALRDWQTMNEQKSVFKTALDVARNKMKIVESQYRQGMASVSDFNETNLELTKAELNLKRHLLLMVLKRNEIEYLSGEPITQWSIQ
ncbi:MAG: TolC family protein [Calditrichaeota bacterium]|nr:TolC family protein [Calditrichota bacterium]